MKTERLHHVTVVSPDAAAARATFERLFALAPLPGDPGALRIGEAAIAFETPAPGSRLAAALAAGGEGMASVCLEVASLEQAARTLERAGVAFETETAAGRRTLHVDPAAAHGVRLALVERA